jgi:hypothetical protein
MKKYIFYTILVLTLTHCTSKNKTVNNQINTDTVATESNQAVKGFFPITSFLKGQLITLDSLPITLMHTITINKKTDTIWLKKQEIRPLLQPFISDEITATNMAPFFTETKFKDETINAITYTYRPTNTLPDSIALRHWDMYINPETGSIQKIYLVKEKIDKDKTYTFQLIWQTNKWAKITTLLKNKNGLNEVVKEEKITWAFTEQ